ncbi:MAG: hypothetical protein M1821_008369 [Bathelium mastoideum]|nr:MAG: hypothetical protein M1821_008369 [Bathelium mastoideum]
MSKRTVYTSITALPAGISRETVVETLHDHLEMIDLNPLVIKRFQCRPPSFASAEEYHCIWYQLTDKVQYLPGGLAQGNVTFHVCFHDLFNGLQTHVYAPLGLDIKEKWSLGGSLPGEPREPVEMGLGAPREGLYLREDVDMRCNFMTTTFVKRTLKKAHEKLVQRMIERAHIKENKNYNDKLRSSAGSTYSASVSDGGGYGNRPFSDGSMALPPLLSPSEDDTASSVSGPPGYGSPRMTYQSMDGKPLLSPTFSNYDSACQAPKAFRASNQSFNSQYEVYQPSIPELPAQHYTGPRITNPDTYPTKGTEAGDMRPAELEG